MAPVYTPPVIVDHGSLAELTQNLLPSSRSLGGTMAALSAPAGNLGGGGTTGSGDSTGSAGDTVINNVTNSPTTGTAPSQSLPLAGIGESMGPSEGAGEPVSANGEGSAPTASATDPVGLASTGEGTGGGGDLPFTGLAAGALAAVGAGIAGAGVALRRATRRS